ncbi:MAG: hypothetical protein NTV80_11570 [Verrucomicrobia bacterium]|nr:hypothetical protein [Verrucomicrobiota bacterium]
MNLRTTMHFITAVLLIGSAAAQTYSSTASTLDAAGSHTSSASYSADGSLGGITGISTSTTPARTIKQGFIGQLIDLSAISISASQLTVNESATTQLSAVASFDDATLLALSSSSVTWATVSGPISSITSSGLVTTGIVYQNTAATVSGSFLGNTGSLGLSIQDSIADNYGSYAGDSLADDWQVQYFGLNNVNAAPGIDFDSDGYSNLNEYTAGTAPTSSASHFMLTANFSNQTIRQLSFSPRLTDRTYLIEYSTDLASWSPLTGYSSSDSGSTRTITDNTTAVPRKFYRVTFTKP